MLNKKKSFVLFDNTFPAALPSLTIPSLTPIGQSSDDWPEVLAGTGLKSFIRGLFSVDNNYCEVLYISYR